MWGGKREGVVGPHVGGEREGGHTWPLMAMSIASFMSHVIRSPPSTGNSKPSANSMDFWLLRTACKLTLNQLARPVIHTISVSESEPASSIPLTTSSSSIVGTKSSVAISLISTV